MPAVGDLAPFGGGAEKNFECRAAPSSLTWYSKGGVVAFFILRRNQSLKTRSQSQRSRVVINSAFFSPGSVKSKPQLRKNSSDEVIAITSKTWLCRARFTQA